jgi:fructoselysine-6-P-deglycase FrlB-like protein
MATGTVKAFKRQIVEGERFNVKGGTGTCSSNAVTINAPAGAITTESLTTAAGSAQAITLTNSYVTTGDLIFVTRNGGTSTTGTLELNATAGSGTATITLTNRHASAAFNGTFILAYRVVRTFT